MEGDHSTDGSWWFCLKVINSERLRINGDDDGIRSDCVDVISNDCREALLAMAENGSHCTSRGAGMVPEACSELEGDSGVEVYGHCKFSIES
jgi:hypothetical protein